MTQQTERELFEAWYFGEAPTSAHANEKTQDGIYKYASTSQAWYLWQAARAPLLSTIAQQGEALEAARKDAERYAYLRDHCSTADVGGLNMIATETVFTTLVPSDGIGEFPACIDAGIDAALISPKVEG
jgi:hypothetical protein